jgi:hypothetical protein
LSVSKIEKLESRVLLQGVTFEPHVTFDVGSRTLALTAVDLSGDGIDDLVSVNENYDTLNVMLARGDGAFMIRHIGAGAFPDAITYSDFNGDGKTDLVVSNLLGNNVSIYLGNGNGTFEPRKSFKVGNHPESVAVGDFNDDGLPDIVTANSRDNDVSILINNTAPGGTLSFLPQITLPVGPKGMAMDPVSVAVADLTGDGEDDIIVADLHAGSISVLINNTPAGGALSFLPPIVFKVGTDPESVAVGNFYSNSDSPDIVVANAYDHTIDVLDNTTTPGGTLSLSLTTTLSLGNGVGNSPFGLAVGDLTNNGTEDIVAAEGGFIVRGREVAVFLGNGDGTFQAPETFYTALRPANVVIGNFSGDGLEDIATANAYDGQVSVLRNNTPTALPTEAGSRVLTVHGTNKADTADISVTGTLLTVRINATSLTFAQGSIGSIVLDMGQKNDSVTIGEGAPSVLVNGGAGNDTIIDNNDVADTLIGGIGNDCIVGGSGTDRLIGGGGNPTLVAGTGNSTLIGGAGHDSLNGDGGGDDLIEAYSGMDTIIGATGSTGMDTIYPAAGDSIDAGQRDVVGPVAETYFSDQAISAMFNIYGAGQSSPPDPGGNGGGVLPPEFDLPANASLLTFSSVTGVISLNDYFEGESNDPDSAGSSSNYGYPIGNFPALDGLSGITAPGLGWLVGVFESDTPPTDPAPASLDFTTLGTDFGSLSPALNQVFFVGDGLTGDGSGNIQQFQVPAGATQLYLGIADGNGASPQLVGSYVDNTGSFTASFTVLATGTQV